MKTVKLFRSSSSPSHESAEEDNSYPEDEKHQEQIAQ